MASRVGWNNFWAKSVGTKALRMTTVTRMVYWRWSLR